MSWVCVCMCVCVCEMRWPWLWGSKMLSMGQISIKTPNPIVFNRVYRLEIKSAMLVFPTPLVNYSAPLTFSPVHLPPLPPSLCKYISTEVCIHTVCKGGGWIGLCGEHIKELYCTLCMWPDSEPTKLLYHIKQTPGGGGGAQTDKHLLPSTFILVNFLNKADI